ncbi:serine hydrolase [Aurantiacibacter gangjinensis]|uniref:serine hydrolase n=1 Tax=Aurantiacibacter gangjinensis TaxID=502682 RepID=UPI00069A0B5F|nr:serine hydrolase [Aurantiacibacter gangjinensis]APE28983.1 Beta-lactamase [Aurantiacibacter gangjinensis]
MKPIRYILPLSAALALAACGEAENFQPPAGVASDNGDVAAAVDPVTEEEPAVPLDAQIVAAREELEATLQDIGKDFGGSLGIAVVDVEQDWQAGFNADTVLPQQSVSKTWVALTAMVMAEAGELDLDAPIRVTREDLTLFHQPIRKEILRDGAVITDHADLIERAIQQSDNTANNALLQRVGGPEAIRAMLAEQGLEGIRFGPGEKPMQAAIAGMEWRDAYSYGSTFFDARDQVPDSVRKRAFESYLADPVDGASAAAIAQAFAAIVRGDVLSEEGADTFLTIMANTRSGPRRLKGGREDGWVVSHKTGTGQFWNGMQSGYNDVGVLFAPDSTPYAVAVMIGVTERPTPERMEMMQSVTRAVIAYHEASRSESAADAPGSGDEEEAG